MADVYILFQSGVTRDGKAVDVGDTADLVFMRAHNDAQEEYLKELEANPQWAEKRTCMESLATFRPAMSKAIDWAQANGKQSQIVKTESDEEGNFSAALPSGKYSVYVRGRAGFNEALWDTGVGNIDIRPGSHTEIKLSSPHESCVDVPD
jgi:hypothetical protein